MTVAFIHLFIHSVAATQFAVAACPAASYVHCSRRTHRSWSPPTFGLCSRPSSVGAFILLILSHLISSDLIWS